MSDARLRAYVVDDEPLALKRLVRLLAATARVEIAGSATDPRQALEAIGRGGVDVAFLDIHMPELSGLALAARLPPATLAVFTTAYDRHAVAAFEVNAVDYLLKPIDAARLSAALDRVAARRAAPAPGDLRAVLARLGGLLKGDAYLAHLASRIAERVQLVPVDDVTHVFARDRGTYAATAAGEHMLDATIAELERKLDPAKFFRIHRATLVNLAYVAELHADLGGRLAVRLRAGRRDDLVVSRDRVRPLKERLGLA
ncbi:MAG: LytTR family transcriptional regulator DNA-binding domain-containing protein [Candidatus Rokubacteria bacterium]|nr:LytTR family transcriptional regulator DNA-binding domain-containing protein [Candidatus Rokubacteria bacterium]